MISLFLFRYPELLSRFKLYFVSAQMIASSSAKTSRASIENYLRPACGLNCTGSVRFLVWVHLFLYSTNTSGPNLYFFQLQSKERGVRAPCKSPWSRRAQVATGSAPYKWHPLPHPLKTWVSTFILSGIVYISEITSLSKNVLFEKVEHCVSCSTKKCNRVPLSDLQLQRWSLCLRWFGKESIEVLWTPSSPPFTAGTPYHTPFSLRSTSFAV